MSQCVDQLKYFEALNKFATLNATRGDNIYAKDIYNAFVCKINKYSGS